MPSGSLRGEISTALAKVYRESFGRGPTSTATYEFGAGYVTQAAWWRIGFVISMLHLAVWLPLGFLWWKLLGLW